MRAKQGASTPEPRACQAGTIQEKSACKCSISSDMEGHNHLGIKMAFEGSESSWFLAQLKPNCANIADKNLKRQGFKTFLPQQEDTRQRDGKFITALRPLFPGYIFVAFDAAGGLWRTVNSTYGVTRLVGFGTEPSPVPLDLITQLRMRCDESGKLLPPKLLKPGDQVTLTKGPFANFVAEVEKIAPDRRVWVLMDILGGRTRVAVAQDLLRTIGN